MGSGNLRLGFVGFGEVGRRFARDLRGHPGVTLSCYDILIEAPATRDRFLAAVREAAVEPRDSLADFISQVDVIVCVVTADRAIAAARAAAPFLRQGQLFLDLNSAAPETKRQAAAEIAAGGGTYVEGAIMAPVAEPGIKVSILLGGAAAVEVASQLTPLGFALKIVSNEIGRASATKLCRSIVIKGLEALMIDCARAASATGVSGDVFASLDASFPGVDFANLAAVMAGRVRQHGARRAAEMMEAAEMVAALGMDPSLCRAIAEAQARGAGTAGAEKALAAD